MDSNNEAISPQLQSCTVADMVSAKLELDHVVKIYVLSTYDKTGCNASKTARLLGIGRTTLYRKLKSWGIDSKDKEKEER